MSVFLVQRNNTKMDEKQGPTSDDVPTGEVTSTTVTEGDVVKMPTDVAITLDAIPNEDEEDKSKGLDPQDNHCASSSDVPVTGAAITDPYHYLTQQHFTSEIFKIEIQNLPRQFGFALPRR
ncbi:uncharacterized protein LOC119745316 [Patiria miniata]|uniref:Uncharacterized protein n=1 Tax=Patiria miniata TaxID=46514 RepID=A0A914BNK2_PATMI|nr:uncharacterized protein LOC119745316 [Patiria miniata]XP_038077530.1 uncharacterized protein LOC119745316 [Patiria miniata]XP_038077531.1 uncharacterized protein LOC119745316 [Patiria miniata]